MAAATATPRRRTSGATSASAPARISSSPAPPRPITASADRISPRAAGSLNASFSAATPSGSPSSAFAIPRGTGRRPFSTSRSQPGTRPGGVASSVPETRPVAMRATVSGLEPAGGVPGIGDDRSERRVVGEEVEERGPRPAETDDDARRRTRVGGIERDRIRAARIRVETGDDQERDGDAQADAHRGAAQAAADGAALGRGQRAAQVAMNGVAAPARAGARRSRSGASARGAPAGARACCGDREVLDDLAQRRVREREHLLAPARVRDQQPARLQRRERLGAAVAPAPGRHAQVGFADAVGLAGGEQGAARERAAGPRGRRPRATAPEAPPGHRCGGNGATTPSRRSTIARVASCRSNGRQGPPLTRSAATAAARPLSNGVPDWTALRSMMSATVASPSGASVIAAGVPSFPDGPPSALVIASRRANAASSIDRTIRVRGASSTTRSASSTTAAASAPGAGPRAGAKTSSRLSRISTRPPFELARDAAQVVGHVLAGDRRRDVDDAGRAHQLALEIAIAGQGHDGQLAARQHGGQPGAQQRRLADARRTRQDDQVSGAAGQQACRGARRRRRGRRTRPRSAPDTAGTFRTDSPATSPSSVPCSPCAPAHRRRIRSVECRTRASRALRHSPK